MSIIFTETHVYKPIPISYPETQVMTAFREYLTEKRNHNLNLRGRYSDMLSMFPVYSMLSDAERIEHSLHPDSDHDYVKMSRLPGNELHKEALSGHPVSAEQLYHAFWRLYLLLTELGRFGYLYTDLHLSNLLYTFTEDSFLIKLVDFTHILPLYSSRYEPATPSPSTRTTLLHEAAIRSFYRKYASLGTEPSSDFDDLLIRRQILGVLLQLCGYDNLSILSFFEGDTCRISQTRRAEIEHSLITLYHTWNTCDKRTGIYFRSFINMLLS